jgi:hypothetical protein
MRLKSALAERKGQSAKRRLQLRRRTHN